jgi:hypothetical protein
MVSASSRPVTSAPAAFVTVMNSISPAEKNLAPATRTSSMPPSASS